MQDEHLSFREQDLFNHHVAKGDWYDDIQDGSVFRDAYYRVVKIQGVDVPCFLIFFINQTHCDEQGRLTLELVMFTLSIFNKETRC